MYFPLVSAIKVLCLKDVTSDQGQSYPVSSSVPRPLPFPAIVFVDTRPKSSERADGVLHFLSWF